MRKLLSFIFFTFIFLNHFNGFCAEKQSLADLQGYKIAYYNDTSNNATISEVINYKFTDSKSNVLNFGLDNATYWIKLIPIKDSIPQLTLWIDQPRLASSQFYVYDSKPTKISEFNPFSYSQPKFTQGILYILAPNIKMENIFYLRLTSREIFVAPINIITKNSLLDSLTLRGTVFGFYTGIMVIMFVYNLFLFIIIRDRSYLYYIFYILSTWITQVTIQGFSSKYFWEQGSFIDNNSVIFFSNSALFFASLFTISFLNTKVFSKTSHILFKIICYATVLNTFVLFIFGSNIAFIIMQLITLTGAIIALSTSYIVYFKKHFKPAGYYLVAWSVLLIGAIFFILKDYSIIPYNNFTIYLLQITSALEVMLLSFALADKINFFKKENEIAQVQALNASIENQKIIKEQNIVLEKRVNERTEELQNTNSTLNVTLTNLKDTQSQLVDAEKMAALGQLTAGIAHEINNPINFVTSNIKPLELDISDLKDIISRYELLDLNKEIKPQIDEIESFKKQIDLPFVNNEISTLIAGISEGARRTAEIIRSLRNFSRLDESDMKPIDINEGLESTLVLVRNNIPDNVTLIKELGNLPKVECQPGKINQVFMNLVSNAIQAIKSKEHQSEEEVLTIKSWYIDQQVKISIKDTGIGMSEEIKHRIFEPFFTTKDVGEGTGLGLSIVFSIIENHKGNIEVFSNINEGTEFLITLNVNL